MTTFEERDAKRREKLKEEMSYAELLELEISLYRFMKHCRKTICASEIHKVFMPVVVLLEEAEEENHQ